MSGFHTDLFDCFKDMESCCIGCYCPCVLTCKSQEKLEGIKSWRQLCFPMIDFNIRQIIRQRMNYEHEPCNDCCAFCFCLPCFACQNYRELKAGYGLPLPGEGYKGYIRTPKGGKEHTHHTEKVQGVQNQPSPPGYPQYNQPQPTYQAPPPTYPSPPPAYPPQQPAYPPQAPNNYYPPQPGYYAPPQNAPAPQSHHKKKDSSSSSSSSS
ncbi:putative Cys-rich domain containing protein [Trichomonas vaginalis G3]|uniref:Uncharacterized Cys-rich domain containing protein n=1 Tax=Trichomonas vaginalis (strain ATCC PRA-98 / G3) TaxID=412133 RepID=A2EQU2_TRIV3|nr:uncharacterized protein TVAGG3_0243670 [Trichomonas vaginalis G3]EAY04988.1 putative Cys-rich domain containing protein [Trichomonas vaginalis G3]KAI5553514.1 DUF614 family protein-related family [Trichomonas vaginalis G3]|eukprot:XP_001317211.1 hypothetical protein [Trichomonas vaginalis G3]